MATAIHIKERTKLNNFGSRSCQFISTVALALMASFVTTPAQAESSLTLLCTELPAPIFTSTTVPTDSLYKEPANRVWASLLNLKAHPLKHSVEYGVSCQIGGDLYSPESWREACQIVSMSYGRWVVNTRNSTRALIWKPVRCRDSLFYRMQ